MADQEIIQEPIEENAFVPAAQNENAEFVSNEEPNKDLENKNADEPIEQPQSLEPAEARDSEGGMASIIGPPSPLTGCYLLIVIGEPHNSDHKDIILQRLIKGLLSWDLSDNHVDLEEELSTLTCQAIEGEEGKHGERLIQFASENLVTEILIHPQFNTFIQCIRNLLSSFTRHRHIIHSGYTFAGNGSWILQDGTFSVSDFAEAFQDYEVQRVLRAYPDTITMDIHCTANGHWTTISDKNFAKTCKIRINPNNVLNSGSEKLNAFINYLSPMVIPTDITDLLESSDVVGNIRFSHPTLYVFPGGQGDAALFGINGFNMLVDGGFSRKSCFWDFVRHLDRLDAVLMTRINNSNISGLNSVIERKSMAHVYPQIGHFFTNIPDKLSIPSSDSVSNNDPLLIDLIKEGQKTITNLKTLNLKAQHCYRDSEPMNLYHKVGHGTLDMYVISPSKDSKEVKEFIQKWNNNDPKLFATKDAKEFIFPLQNMISICALLIWTPANPEDNVTRILFPGSTPQAKIFEGMDKVKSLEFLKTPVCTVKSLSSSSSTIIMAKKNYKSSISDKNHLDSPKPISKLLECDSKGNDVDNKVIESKSNEITKEDIAQETKKEQNVLKSVPNATKTSKSRTELKRIENKIIKKIDPKDSDGESQEEKKSDEDKKPEKKVEKKEDLDARVTKSKTNRLKTDSKVMARSRIDTKPPKTLSERKPLRKDGIDTTKEIIRSSPPTPKKSSTKSTEDTKLSSSAAPREVKKTVTRTIRASPKNTPGKSTKEANNRKVLESTQKLPHHKREINKQPKNDRKLAPHYAKALSPQTGSPSKKIKSEKDTIIRKSRTDKNGTTDSSLVSTPSADEAYKRVTEPLEQEVKSEDLEELKEEQEAVREIEAVFQREQIKDVSKKLIAEDHRDIQDSATEADEEDEYLIIEKEDQYTEDSVNDAESSATKEEEIQKLQRDSEESEKRRKGSLEVTEEENEEEALIDEVEKDDGKSEKHKIQKTDELEETDDDGKIVDLPTNNEKPQEIEQIKEILQEQVQEIIVSAKEMAKTKLEAPEVKPDEISSTTPEEKVTSKKTSEKEDDINQQAVSQPEEKFSTNVESGATTTAPTLPEDERCPLDEIKEDLVIEEKHVKENTREKEMLQNTLHRTHEPLERQSPPKLPIQSTVAPHLRDIVKTPDEVADLPVHEEADMDVYEEGHKSTEKELKKLNSKDCDQIDINDEKTETVKLETDVYVKQEDFINKVGEAVEEQILKTDTEVNKLATENENDVALRQNFEKPPSSVDKTIPGSRKSSINDDNANSNQTLSDSRKTLICSSKPSSPDKVESTLTVEIESRDPDTQIVELPVNQTNEDTNKKSQESSRASSPKPETKTNEKLNLATDTEDSNKISSPEPHVEDQAVSIIQEQTIKLSKDNSKVASPSRIDGSKDTQNVPENITKTIEALDFEVYQEKSNKTISPQPEENVSNIHDEPEEVSRPNMKDYKEELEITSYKTHEETKDKPEDSNKAPSPQLEDINRASSPQHEESSKASSLQLEDSVDDKVNLSTETNLLKDSTELPSPVLQGEDKTEKHTTASSKTCEETKDKPEDSNKASSPQPEDINRASSPQHEESSKASSLQLEDSVDDKVNLSTETNLLKDSTEVPSPVLQGEDKTEKHTTASSKTFEETKDKPEDSNKASSPQPEDINRASSPQHEESSKASSLQLEDNVDEKVNLSTETNLLKDSTEVLNPVVQCEDKTEKHTTASYKTHEETKDKPEDSNKAPSPQLEDINRASSPQHEESSKASSLQLEDNVDEKVNLSTETNLLKDSTEVPSPVLQGEDKTEKHTTASSETFEEKKDKSEVSNKATSPQPEDIKRASSPQHEESSKALSLQLEDNVDEKVNLSTETNLLKDSTEVPSPVLQGEDKTEKHTTASSETFEEKKDKSEVSNKATSPQPEDIKRASSPQHEESSKALSLQLEDNVDEKVNLSTETHLLKDSSEISSPILKGDDKIDKHPTACSETFEETKDKSEDSNKAFSPQREKENLTTETHLIRDSVEIPSSETQIEDEKETSILESSETHEAITKKSEEPCEATSPESEEPNEVSTPQPEESNQASFTQPVENLTEKINSIEIPSADTQTGDEKETSILESSETDEVIMKKPEEPCEATSTESERLNEVSFSQLGESRKNSFQSSEEFRDDEIDKLEMKKETSKACTENESGKNKQDIPEESLQIISPQIEENQDQNKSSLFLERDVNQTQSSEFTICPKTHIETIQIISEINDGVATILGVTIVDSSDKSTEKIHSEVSSPSSNLSTVEQHLKSDTEPNIKLSKMSTDTCISMTSEHIDDIMESENIDDMMESIKNSAHHAVDFTKEDIKQIETEMKEAGEKIIESVKIEVASKVAASEVNSQTFKNEMQKVADEADQAVKKLVESVQAEIVASTNLINEQSQSLEEATKNSLSEKKSLTRTNIEELREELTNTKKEIEDLAKQTTVAAEKIKQNISYEIQKTIEHIQESTEKNIQLDKNLTQTTVEVSSSIERTQSDNIDEHTDVIRVNDDFEPKINTIIMKEVTTEIRETHITTVDSPMKEKSKIDEITKEHDIVASSFRIEEIKYDTGLDEIQELEEEDRCSPSSKLTTSSCTIRPRTPEEVQKIVAEVAEVLKSDKELTDIIPDFDEAELERRLSQKSDDTGLGHRMLLTASSEDGGGETEINTQETTLVNQPQSPELSGKSSPEIRVDLAPDIDQNDMEINAKSEQTPLSSFEEKEKQEVSEKSLAKHDATTIEKERNDSFTFDREEPDRRESTYSTFSEKDMTQDESSIEEQKSPSSPPLSTASHISDIKQETQNANQQVPPIQETSDKFPVSLDNEIQQQQEKKSGFPSGTTDDQSPDCYTDEKPLDSIIVRECRSKSVSALVTNTPYKLEREFLDDSIKLPVVEESINSSHESLVRSTMSIVKEFADLTKFPVKDEVMDSSPTEISIENITVTQKHDRSLTPEPDSSVFSGKQSPDVNSKSADVSLEKGKSNEGSDKSFGTLERDSIDGSHTTGNTTIEKDSLSLDSSKTGFDNIEANVSVPMQIFNSTIVEHTSATTGSTNQVIDDLKDRKTPPTAPISPNIKTDTTQNESIEELHKELQSTVSSIHGSTESIAKSIPMSTGGQGSGIETPESSPKPTAPFPKGLDTVKPENYKISSEMATSDMTHTYTSDETIHVESTDTVVSITKTLEPTTTLPKNENTIVSEKASTVQIVLQEEKSITVHKSNITENDSEDEGACSAMSTSPQPPASPYATKFNFETEISSDCTDPMNTSFYGSLPEVEKPKTEETHAAFSSQFVETVSSPVEVAEFRHTTSDKYFDEADLDFDKVMTSDTENKDRHESKEKEKKAEETLASWGKPLGLPSPALTPAETENRTTPKKERKQIAAKTKLNNEKNLRKRGESPASKKRPAPVYVELAYVPHHGNSYYSHVEYFRRIRARYYVFSGTEPSREVFNALLEAKQTWEDKELEVTIIPTYDTDVLGYWVSENEELLSKYHIDLSPSAARCTINLQDHETSCSAYRLEF
ncbi:microtubule-associated protein futsch isoform X2 [Culicoides brevitarsis]|uniref:microtubule-associated protein futsch isoform X2 n=1 Tax=Culicoides brevitarsis TaxID=469753 RepID=UPI00307BA07E